MKKFTKILALVIMLVITLSFAACSNGTANNDTTSTPSTTSAPPDTTSVPDTTSEPEPEIVVDLPRKETLYVEGLQWGPSIGWNALSTDMNNPLAIDQQGGGARVTMFESLYMYNMLDGSMVPLLADGDYVWNDDMTEMTIKIKPAAKWSDGTSVTADDVAFTWTANVEYTPPKAATWTPYIDTIEAVDESTVLITCKLEGDKPANPLMVVTYIEQQYVLQKAWLEKLIERNGGDPGKIVADPGEDIVYSGPYGQFFRDDTKTVLIRDENYWGQDDSMWGKLPAPKYLAHNVYADNAAGVVALKAGEVDVCQEFISNVHKLWIEDGLPISTYIDEAPYHLCVNMPTAWYNMSSYGLDNPVIRKAIAMAVDYDTINANAVTYQSPTFADVPRSLMNPTPGEQALYDHDAVKDLQWIGKDIEGANQLLDDAGILKNADGWRELDGKKLEYNACCPSGWNDWEAAMEIVAAAGKEIGIDISTNFPEWDVYQVVVTGVEQSDYDIFMMWTDSATPAQPWSRIRNLMSSEYNGVEGNWSGNWGHYANDRVDELLKLIPIESDHDKVVEMYTELVEIYLTEVPSFSLMYRPDQFHVINESVWTGFTEQGDGNNIPPGHATDGYAIADLYNIYLVEE